MIDCAGEICRQVHNKFAFCPLKWGFKPRVKMASDAPRLLARNGGVLKIPASATQHRPSMPSATGAPSGPRLKLVIRHLPPGLTEEEFRTLLGAEWNVGNGKVDWAIYKPGKVSKE